MFQQWYTAFDSLQNMLSCKWINSPTPLRQSFNKLKQLQLAKDHGFLIPNTIVTNSPSKAVEFVRSNFNDVIVKPLLHHRIESKSKLYNLHTHAITRDDIPKLGDLSYAPCILQERIHKGSELRITVVENRVFASEIFPKQVGQDFVDIHTFRIQNLITKPVAINEDFKKRCVALIKSMNLKFGAIDFVKDMENNLYFLEVNALGDWLWIEQEYKLPITESVANLIAGMTK
jgi:glutathione synthase/RimK-type ligase-like ATP-grasp enzyme